MNLKISKKMRFSVPALLVLALIFSFVGAYSAQAAPIGVNPVSAEKASNKPVIIVKDDAVRPFSAAKAIKPVGSIGDVNKSTSVSCAHVDFNGDNVIDTRDVIAYLNSWASKDISADMNGDKEVDSKDYNMFISGWKLCQSSECSVSDFNGDKLIDTRDITAFLNAWRSGDSRADVNADGRVSGMDIPFFFSTWRKCNV